MLDAPLLDQLPDTMTIEQDGKAMPMREHPFIKEAKDWPTFAKTALDAHREVGARVRIPDPTKAKPEEVQAFTKTLYEKGILHAPPAKPEDYGLHVKPEKLPEGFTWNDASAQKLAGILHKHGVTKELVPDLLALHQEMQLGQKQSLKTSQEEGLKALKAEFGDKYEERAELAGRLGTMIFKTPEEMKFFEDNGLANHPAFLSVLMRLGPLAAQDSGFLEGATGGGGATADAVKAEVWDIIHNKDNPKHAAFLKNDMGVSDYIDSLYRKIPGADKQVDLTGGISVTGKPA